MEKKEYKEIVTHLTPKETELYDSYLYLANADKSTRSRSKELIAIIESKAALLAACRATMDYWKACAESARKHGDVGTSPQVHAADDELHLSELCNKAAKMIQSAIEQAGEDK